MKRSYITLIIIILSLTQVEAVAQSYIQIWLNLNLGDRAREYRFHNDIHELESFHEMTDRFLYFSETHNWRKVRALKLELLRAMKNEIRQTENQLYDYSDSRKYRSRTYIIGKNDHKYGKRRSGSLYRLEDFEHSLEERLKIQHRLYHKFERLPLKHRNGRGYRNQLKKHESILFQFEDTMKQDLLFKKRGAGHRHHDH